MSQKGEQLEALVRQVESYERKHLEARIRILPPTRSVIRPSKESFDAAPLLTAVCVIRPIRLS